MGNQALLVTLVKLILLRDNLQKAPPNWFEDDTEYYLYLDPVITLTEFWSKRQGKIKYTHAQLKIRESAGFDTYLAKLYAQSAPGWR